MRYLVSDDYETTSRSDAYAHAVLAANVRPGEAIIIYCLDPAAKNTPDGMAELVGQITVEASGPGAVATTWEGQTE